MRSHIRFTSFLVNAVVVLLCAAMVHAGPPMIDNVTEGLKKVSASLKAAQIELDDQAELVKRGSDQLMRLQDSFRVTGDKKQAQRDLRVLKDQVADIASDHQNTDAFIATTGSSLVQIAKRVTALKLKFLDTTVQQLFARQKETELRSDAVQKSLDALGAKMSAFAVKIR